MSNAIIRVDDVVRCDNPESFCYGRWGVVVEVWEAPEYEPHPSGDPKLRRLVSGDPDMEGETTAWVDYGDGMRVPHAVGGLHREDV